MFRNALELNGGPDRDRTHGLMNAIPAKGVIGDTTMMRRARRCKGKRAIGQITCYGNTTVLRVSTS
jgi:hypothetical protein